MCTVSSVMMLSLCCVVIFFFSSRRRHTRCALVTGVQTCALPICLRCHEPLVTVDGAAQLGQVTVVLGGVSATVVAHQVGCRDLESGVVAPLVDRKSVV